MRGWAILAAGVMMRCWSPGIRCLGGHMMLSDGVKIQLVPDRGGQGRRLPWHDTRVK